MSGKDYDSPLFTIYVKDVKLSENFYKNLLNLEPEIKFDSSQPTINKDGTSNFSEFHFDYGTLVIKPVEEFIQLFGSNTPSEIVNRTELFFYTSNKSEFEKRLIKSGGKIITKKIRIMDNRNEEISYALDLDRNIIAFS